MRKKKKCLPGVITLYLYKKIQISALHLLVKVWAVLKSLLNSSVML